MRLATVELKNFKRFTDLTIADIPASAKLVLLIGANGSGKSSVFDAFEFLSRPTRGNLLPQAAYYQKSDQTNAVARISTHENETAERVGDNSSGGRLASQF